MVIRIRGPKKYRQYNGQKQKVQKDKHGESCGDIDKHGESCGDIDKHGESCGDLDCGFLITEKQCINEPNYINI